MRGFTEFLSINASERSHALTTCCSSRCLMQISPAVAAPRITVNRVYNFPSDRISSPCWDPQRVSESWACLPTFGAQRPHI